MQSHTLRHAPTPFREIRVTRGKAPPHPVSDPIRPQKFLFFSAIRRPYRPLPPRSPLAHARTRSDTLHDDFPVLSVQGFNASTLHNKSLPAPQSCVLFSGARAHGMRTYEPRQGRKAATVVCFASAVVTLVYLNFRTRGDWPGSNQNAHR